MLQRKDIWVMPFDSAKAAEIMAGSPSIPSERVVPFDSVKTAENMADASTAQVIIPWRATTHPYWDGRSNEYPWIIDPRHLQYRTWALNRFETARVGQKPISSMPVVPCNAPVIEDSIAASLVRALDRPLVKEMLLQWAIIIESECYGLSNACAKEPYSPNRNDVVKWTERGHKFSVQLRRTRLLMLATEIIFGVSNRKMWIMRHGTCSHGCGVSNCPTPSHHFAESMRENESRVPHHKCLKLGNSLIVPCSHVPKCFVYPDSHNPEIHEMGTISSHSYTFDLENLEKNNLNHTLIRSFTPPPKLPLYGAITIKKKPRDLTADEYVTFCKSITDSHKKWVAQNPRTMYGVDYNPYVCAKPGCNFVCRKKQSLEQHMISEGLNIPIHLKRTSNSPKIPNGFICLGCGWSNEGSSRWASHIMSKSVCRKAYNNLEE
jgi:hypothetical protein